jgi:hypothetical protein
VQQAIAQWLGDQVDLTDVTVLSGANPSNGLDEGSLLITVSYTLVDTQTPASVSVQVS